MADSLQKKLSRVRKPRVHLTYEVEEGGQEHRELPFVVGVMAELTGNNPGESPKPLRERNFTQIDRDNFDDVMARLRPGLKLRVANTLAKDDSELNVELSFKSMRDFEPAAIARQVEPLRKLLEARDQLRDLQARVDRSPDLEAKLEEILRATQSTLDEARRSS